MKLCCQSVMPAVAFACASFVLLLAYVCLPTKIFGMQNTEKKKTLSCFIFIVGVCKYSKIIEYYIFNMQFKNKVFKNFLILDCVRIFKNKSNVLLAMREQTWFLACICI